MQQLDTVRKASLKVVASFIEVAEVAISLGGQVLFVWPRSCVGWQQPLLVNFMQRNQLYDADVDGCACGMQDLEGQPRLKQWRFHTSSARLAAALAKLPCHGHQPPLQHREISGQETPESERYPPNLCRTVLSSLFGDFQRAPAMTCVPPTTHGHREHDVCTSAFDAPCHYFHANSSTDATASDGGDLVPAMVTKLLDRREWKHHPKAFDAIKDEGKSLVAAKT